MNLNVEGTMRLVKAKYDGTGFQMMSDQLLGSGHPTLHPRKNVVVTDSYLKEPCAYGDGTTPIRLLCLDDQTEQALVRIRTRLTFADSENLLRVDPHPAWDRTFRYVVFNGCPTGERQVFIADLQALL